MDPGFDDSERYFLVVFGVVALFILVVFVMVAVGAVRSRRVLRDSGLDPLAAHAQDTSSLAKSLEKLRVVNDPSFPRNLVGWRELMGSTPYTLAAGSKMALDPTVLAARRELRDINNKPFVSFPEQGNVTYRVYVHDDDSSTQNDADNTVWVVAMGEVAGKDGVVLARSVVRALVTSTAGSLDNDGLFQKGGGSTKEAVMPSSATTGLGESTRI